MEIFEGVLFHTTQAQKVKTRVDFSRCRAHQQLILVFCVHFRHGNLSNLGLIDTYLCHSFDKIPDRGIKKKQ